MTRSKFLALRPLRDFCRDRKGSTIAIVAALVPALVRCRRADGRCRAGHGGEAGVERRHAGSGIGRSLRAVVLQCDLDHRHERDHGLERANPVANVTVTASTPTLVCVTSTSNLPSCNGTSPNAVSVSRRDGLDLLPRSVRALLIHAHLDGQRSQGRWKRAVVERDVRARCHRVDGSEDTNCTVPGISLPRGSSAPSIRSRACSRSCRPRWTRSA